MKFYHHDFCLDTLLASVRFCKIGQSINNPKLIMLKSGCSFIMVLGGHYQGVGDDHQHGWGTELQK